MLPNNLVVIYLTRYMFIKYKCISLQNNINKFKVLRKAVEVRLLKEINMECTTLSARNVAFTSVLSRYRSVANLYHYGDTLLDEIIREMSER
jgi:hypothetical protein